ncbi:hypothetical protein TorRG33x02_126840 [Trema orientale]|uniref:Anther-specific protein BCP1 n=1 Tax=Trema orientale TaxID=63057 RepID=A0A2P5F0U2_TREOI|nr:hypothetical protein TorRG33x02_126840 [Trema orientale]
MARRAVVLALVLVAFVGLACADTQGSEPAKGDTASIAAAAAVPPSGDTDDEQIGNSNDDDASQQDDVVEAPVGGPVPPGAFPPGTVESPPESVSGASGLEAASAFAGVAVAAVAGYFF